jgi:DNA repair exonuclease SbcCD ATPase subunit
VTLKTVEFKKIKVRNFLSYGDSPIEVEFKDGITFVTGYNKDEDSYNGVGKTSLIVESLSFLLFGETYRDINQKLIKNKFGGKTCIVEGWLKVNNDELYIVRSLSPNKLILSVNGDSDNYTKSVPETNKDIIERLGVSKTVFTNTIVMTNKESMSFLNQKKEVKTKFIEGILGLESFTEFLRIAKEEAKIIDDNRSRKYQETTLIERDLENDKTYYEQHSVKIQNDIIYINNKIEQLKLIQPVDNSNEITQLENDKIQYEQSLPEKEDKVNRATKRKLELEAEKNQKEKIIRQLSGKLPECPSCKRPFENHNKDEIENEKVNLQKEVNELIAQVDKFTRGINKLNSEIQDIKSAIKQSNYKIQYLNNDQQEFIKSEYEINNLKDQLQKVQSSVNPFSDKILKSEERLTFCKKELDSFIQESKIANIIKEAASPTGIKSIVIKKVIDSLNNRINHYLIRLQSPFRIYFDEFFEESFKSIKNEEYCYGSLSGGEAKRIDFAMLFAFRDIRRLQSNVHINLTVMDELFDSALDATGMNSIMELLKEMVEQGNQSYFVVTHRKENVEQSGCEMIELIKENGVTRLINE